MIKIVTRSAKETKKVAKILAEEASGYRGSSAFIIAMEGELGAGKTTFAQGFAAALGVTNRVQSPTFVLMKIYELRQATRNKRHGFKHLVHIDCYRIAHPKELVHLGLKDILKDRDAIVLIEWADRIKKILPRGVTRICFTHGRHINERTIAVEMTSP